MEATRKPENLKLQPAYPLATAARILGMHPTTLRGWLSGRDYAVKNGKKHSPAVLEGTTETGAALSFIDLVEAHMLLAIRRGYGIPLKNFRNAMAYLREESGDLLFLAHRDFKFDRKHLYMTANDRLVSLSERGQHVNLEIVQEGLKQLVYGEDGYAEKYFPMLNGREQKTIMLTPGLGFGRPVLADLGISVDAVAARFRAGEYISELAVDYNAQVKDIEDAIRWADRRAA